MMNSHQGLNSIALLATIIAVANAQQAVSPQAATAEAPMAVEAAISQLRDDDPRVRWQAARSLGLVGAAARPAAPELSRLLRDEDPVVQIHAAVALARIGDRSNATVDGLLRAASSNDSRVARTAILALRRLEVEPDRLAAALEKLLQSDDQAVVVYVVESIVAAGEQSTPLLKAALQEEKAAYWACVAIADIGPDAAATVPELIVLLGRSDDLDTLSQALLALASIGPQAAAAVPAIEKLMVTEDHLPVALHAAYALGAIGSPAANPMLERFAASDDEVLSMVSTWSLAKIDRNQAAWLDRATEKLLDGLASDNPLVRRAAAQGIVDLKPPPDRVASRLIEAASDPDPMVAANVGSALASLGPAVVPSAVKALENPPLRPIMVDVLGRLGPDSKQAAARLAELLPEANNRLKRNIHYALAAMGPHAGPATEALADSTQNEEPAVRHSALYALRQLGPAATAAVPQVVALLESNENFDRLAAAWALARIAPSDEPVMQSILPVLRAGLAEGHAVTRYETVIAIGESDDLGKALRDDLRRVAEKEEDEQVRAAATEVVNRFRS